MKTKFLAALLACRNERPAEVNAVILKFLASLKSGTTLVKQPAKPPKATHMSTSTELIDSVFRSAHTANKFTGQPVDDALLRDLYELAKWGPTSVNCQPMRLVFVRSAEGKQRLQPALMPGNVDKTMVAPVVVIVATDKRFYEQLPTQFPAMPGVRDMLAADAGFAQSTGFRNSSLQGAYLMVAARMLGLAVGPMSGFNPAALNAEFFPSGDWEVNFLFNLGYGDPAGDRPRGPRLDFGAVAQMV